MRQIIIVALPFLGFVTTSFVSQNVEDAMKTKSLSNIVANLAGKDCNLLVKS